MDDRQPLGIALNEASDGQLRAVLNYLDARIDAMSVDRREVVAEIDRRAVESREKLEALKIEKLSEAQSGRED